LFKELDELAAGVDVLPVGYCVYSQLGYTNKALKWDCTARKNGNRATTKLASSGNMSAASAHFSRGVDVEEKCY
jgi:hypothetical protein